MPVPRCAAGSDDPLLTQVGRNLVPTPLGASLGQPVRDLLLRTEATLDSRPMFDPATARRSFKLLMSDYVSTVLMAELSTRAERLAPHVSFEVLPQSLHSINSIESGEVDLLIMPDQLLPRGIHFRGAVPRALRVRRLVGQSAAR